METALYLSSAPASCATRAGAPNASTPPTSLLYPGSMPISHPQPSRTCGNQHAQNMSALCLSCAACSKSSLLILKQCNFACFQLTVALHVNIIMFLKSKTCLLWQGWAVSQCACGVPCQCQPDDRCTESSCWCWSYIGRRYPLRNTKDCGKCSLF